MDCKICELKQRQFYCENCLRTHLHDLRSQTGHYALDRDEHVSRARKAMDDTMTPARLSRAALADCQRRVEELQVGLTKLRKENEKKRDRLRTLRETLASRRRTISAAKLQTSSTSNLHSTIISPSPPPLKEATALSGLSATITRARSGLVQELVEVFNVVEVGGRPPIGGKAGTKGEWTIGDLILPVPGDMRRYPPDHINAVITHTIHFLSLLTFYLGIKLPFEVVWTGSKLGVGQPWIGAVKGGESGGWARWHEKHPLHLSSSPTPAPPPSSVEAQPAGNESSLAASMISADPPSSSLQSSFTTALSMLLYDVCYLAYTQNVEVPLSQAGDVLSNLWMVCCSSSLEGKKSMKHTYPFSTNTSIIPT
ncbi:UV radiation resistance protein/autophagy-related protein 14 [Gymnopilus junonius]|uniref:Autophagy-related protein 14 n=1 Tax=Gymnopilus junonius TaxID=109634 RepID=A0A9P5NCU7_GYMJU|nr:UV radiation resistance protein/autophagy-related protein 14 [Gymnopilus junonius]